MREKKQKKLFEKIWEIIWEIIYKTDRKKMVWSKKLCHKFVFPSAHVFSLRLSLSLSLSFSLLQSSMLSDVSSRSLSLSFWQLFFCFYRLSDILSTHFMIVIRSRHCLPYTLPSFPIANTAIHYCTPKQSLWIQIL